MILGWILTSSAFCDRIPSTQLAPSVSRVVARRHATTTESRPFGPFAPKPRTPEAEGGVGPPPPPDPLRGGRNDPPSFRSVASGEVGVRLGGEDAAADAVE